ncbi:MAG: rod shape-determining protein MreC [Chloroflexi bacterium]|nr:rod shape-determining protein MreC [Chloroflexota bacterium]
MLRTQQVGWLIAMLAVGLALLAGSALRNFASFELDAAGLIGSLSRAAAVPAQPVADFAHHVGQTQALSEENAELRQEVARLEANLAALREQQLRSAQVTELITAVGPEAADRYVPAAVLFRDPAPAREAVTIDRGLTDGVRVGQPVLGPGATLVGVISAVEEHQARVRLLIDVDSAIPTVVQSSRTQAALTATPEGLRLEFVPSESLVTIGDTVLSSALGGELPGGLLVGRVSAFESDPREIFAYATVEPLADYSRLEHVLVLTDFRPAPPEPDDRTSSP